MRIALVHDWLTGYRGGERVLLHLAKRFPNADLFTLIHERGSVPPEIENRRIHTSVLDRIPGRERHYRKLLPLFPGAIRRFDLRGYDLVLSTSHAVAKSVAIPTGTPHLDYCFTPMRYVWDQADAYLGRGARRMLATPVVRALRRFDRRTSGPDSVTRFVAISHEVARRIRDCYDRPARVIAPPVDLSWIDIAQDSPGDYYLLVGGFVPYKREQLAIESFRGLDRELVVVGDGPMRARLEREAPPNIRFLGRVDDAELAGLYAGARALIYPQREDFGLVAVEAQAAGRPVIAFGQGGATDTIRPLDRVRTVETGEAHPSSDQAVETGEAHPSSDQAVETGEAHPSSDRPVDPDATGLFFHEATPAALRAAIERFEKHEGLFEPKRLRRWAERFGPERFDTAFDREIEHAIEAVRS